MNDLIQPKERLEVYERMLKEYALIQSDDKHISYQASYSYCTMLDSFFMPNFKRPTLELSIKDIINKLDIDNYPELVAIAPKERWKPNNSYYWNPSDIKTRIEHLHIAIEKVKRVMEIENLTIGNPERLDEAEKFMTMKIKYAIIEDAKENLTPEQRFIIALTKSKDKIEPSLYKELIEYTKKRNWVRIRIVLGGIKLSELNEEIYNLYSYVYKLKDNSHP